MREGWSTLLMFLRLESQWHVTACADGEMQYQGIRRDAIEFELRYSDGFPRRIWNRVKDDLIAMETAALNVMNQALSDRRRARWQQQQRK